MPLDYLDAEQTELRQASQSTAEAPSPQENLLGRNVTPDQAAASIIAMLKKGRPAQEVQLIVDSLKSMGPRYVELTGAALLKLLPTNPDLSPGQDFETYVDCVGFALANRNHQLQTIVAGSMLEKAQKGVLLSDDEVEALRMIVGSTNQTKYSLAARVGLTARKSISLGPVSLSTSTTKRAGWGWTPNGSKAVVGSDVALAASLNVTIGGIAVGGFAYLTHAVTNQAPEGAVLSGHGGYVSYGAKFGPASAGIGVMAGAGGENANGTGRAASWAGVRAQASLPTGRGETEAWAEVGGFLKGNAEPRQLAAKALSLHSTNRRRHAGG